ncbi:MAG: hypothetical protein Q9191_006781, partial [Dirinaria sp. TL-2023a]
MGRSVAQAALTHSDLVTAVGRSYHDTLSSMQQSYPTSFSSSCLPLLCDVRVRETVSAVLETSIAHWGRVDVIANCSGYGVIGSIEDHDEWELRNQFEVNFWGTVNILQLSLPYFRTRGQQQQGKKKGKDEEDDDEEEQEENTRGSGDGGKGGRYLIFSSTSGALGVPGL